MGRSRRTLESGQPVVSLQSYQCRLSEWSRPLNKNKESYLVLEGALWVSGKVDRLLRRKVTEDGYPVTNLRWVASWKCLLIILLVVLSLIWAFKT